MSKSTTPSGLPYPNPDDPVRDGSQRIRELAEALEPRIPKGVAGAVGNYTVGPAGYCTVTFPRNVQTATCTYAGSFAVAFTVNVIGGTDVQIAVRNMIDGTLIPNTTVTVLCIAILN